jgi:ATP-binding cassette subfamily B protein
MYLAGIYAAMFYLDWQLAAMMLVLLPMLYGWMLIYRKYASKYNHVVREKLSDMNAIINESIQGMTIIQAFRNEKQMKNEFEELNNTHYKFQQKLLILEATASHNMVGVLRSLIFILFIAYFGTGSLTGETAVTVGVLYAFIDYIIRLFNPISGIVNQFSRLEQALVAAERVFRLLDRNGEPVSDEKIARSSGQ